ncbi:MAG: transporter related [Bacilli bacterium]|nr:transporter related [Bacilli bacterium]
MLEVVNLSKKFRTKKGEVVGVDRVTFSAKPGQVYGLLGPNGAGKTTTLRMIATLMQADQGEIRVDGYDVRSEPHEVRKRIGYLSSETGIYERFTPRQQLHFFADISGMAPSVTERRIKELSLRLGMGEFLDRRVNRFSTGMKQKVSIARALIHNPSVVIFDEPTTGLDLFAARSVVRTIRELRSEGKTIILSTHIMSEAEQLCDRIGIIHKGTLFQSGTLDELRMQTGLMHMDEIFFRLIGDEEV